LNYIYTFGLTEGKGTSVMHERVQVSVNSTGTVHLFIGTGRSLCEITFMPFMFTIDLITIYQGLDILFLLKSVPFSAAEPKSSLARSFGAGSTFVPTLLSILYTASSRVQRFLYIYYAWETLLIMFLRTFGRRRPPTICYNSFQVLGYNSFYWTNRSIENMLQHLKLRTQHTHLEGLSNCQKDHLAHQCPLWQPSQ
jgi:hypothetical protein